MNIQTKFISLLCILITIAALGLLSNCNKRISHIDYNKDVKPIINKHCISCHGGVKQNSGFSLLSPQFAFENTDSGKPAIIPGSADSSEIIRRLTLEDLEERMPLDHPKLSKDEISVLRNWVDQGAKWGLHWAYALLEPQLMLKNKSNDQNFSISNFIDEQVLEKLKPLGLKPSPEASKPELLRRLAMDIIGMPAPLSLQDDYLEDNISYEQLVDTLLNMPQFGEKWTSMWLDIARYADSKGFEKDPNRNIWRYRDYVIAAFNKDKSYDQFIVEQMAGDLLQNPTQEQLIATGFHRNTQTNDEGGTNNEEFRVKAVLDRVNTTWEGLMATTMACVQCHSHPYDPITHDEYYKSFAFLNNTRDSDTHMDYPRLSILDSLSETKMQELKVWISQVENEDKANEIEEFVRTIQPVIYSIETDQLINAAFYDTKYLGLRKKGSARLSNVELTDNTSLLIKANNYIPKGKLEIRVNDIDGPLLGTFQLNKKTAGFDLLEIELKKSEGIKDLFLVYKNPSLSNPNRPGIQIDWLYFSSGFPGKGKIGYQTQSSVFKELIDTPYESTLIMKENGKDRKRETHMFDRGNWLIKGEKVSPGVPLVLTNIESDQNTRLDFANWIADENNPLTSRTYVNRIWEQLFGRGIVETVEDMGSQGSSPSHEELLDGLSYEFMHEFEWSTKELIKSMVHSSSYKQSSVISKEKQNKDPNNKWLSRSPRKRASAEQIRDQALFLSGKLSSKMYGPPVMPYQPDGVWQSPYSSEKWEESQEEDQFRRAIYTMIKRTALYPSMETFDMAQRQVCVSRRINTNSPLQALVTLNDPVYVECAHHLAERMQNHGSDLISEKINFAYQLAMSRVLVKEKVQILENLYNETYNELEMDNPDEKELLSLTSVASAILNLDEILNY